MSLPEGERFSENIQKKARRLLLLTEKKCKTSVIEEINEAYQTDLIGIHEYWLLTDNYKILNIS